MMKTVCQDPNTRPLLKYNIFIMKVIQCGISFFILFILPLILDPPSGHMYCIASGPTLVIGLLFILLYILRRVPLFMEKMYLFFQIWFSFGAFIQCFILNIAKVKTWLIYGPFYFILLSALVLDLFFIANERGCTFNVA